MVRVIVVGIGEDPGEEEVLTSAGVLKADHVVFDEVTGRSRSGVMKESSKYSCE